MNEDLKKASWIELFYDVAFIALVAQLTYLATVHHQTLTDFLYIGVIGYAIFNAWWVTTANRNLYPEESSNDKLLIQLQMVGAFLMSVTMSGVFEGVYMPFFAALAGVRLLQTLMLARMYYVYPDSRPVTYNILTGFLVSTVLWAAAALVDQSLHLILIVAVLAIDILLPLTRGKGNNKRYLNVSHLHERLGLFLMLVIGESMIVVALSNPAGDAPFDHLNIILSGLGLMSAIWWLYFEYSDRHSAVRPKNLFAFLHAHGLMYISIILISVSYKLAIEGGQSETAIAFLLTGAFGIVSMILLVRSTLHHVRPRSMLRVILVLLLMIGGMLLSASTGSINTAAFTVTVLFIGLAILDYWDFFVDTNRSAQVQKTNTEESAFENDVLN